MFALCIYFSVTAASSINIEPCAEITLVQFERSVNFNEKVSTPKDKLNQEQKKTSDDTKLF